jgi:hypothetical protein
VASALLLCEDANEDEEVFALDYQTEFKTTLDYFNALLPIHENTQDNGYAHIDLQTDEKKLEATVVDNNINSTHDAINFKSWVQDVVNSDGTGGPSRYGTKYIHHMTELFPTNELLRFELGEEKPLVVHGDEIKACIAP